MGQRGLPAMHAHGRRPRPRDYVRLQADGKKKVGAAGDLPAASGGRRRRQGGLVATWGGAGKGVAASFFCTQQLGPRSSSSQRLRAKTATAAAPAILDGDEGQVRVSMRRGARWFGEGRRGGAGTGRRLPPAGGHGTVVIMPTCSG
jgi:hypothetical protein